MTNFCYYLHGECKLKKDCVFIKNCPHKKARDTFKKTREVKDD